MTARLAPLIGDRITPTLRLVLDQRRQLVDAALETFRAQYANFANQLERRFLRRVAIRHEEAEYRALFRDRLIGPELYAALRRGMRGARHDVEHRPRLDLNQAAGERSSSP